MIPTTEGRFFQISIGYSRPCGHILSIDSETQMGTVICGTHDRMASISLKGVLAFDVDKALNVARKSLYRFCAQLTPC